MANPMPPYIRAATISDPVIRYVWDDTRATDDVAEVSEDLPDRARPLTVRAKIALGIGIYQWLIWRFAPVLSDPFPFQLEEAAWCANADLRYMAYFEIAREDWLGPVRGPLWCAITWLVPMIFEADLKDSTWESGLVMLADLANHVLPRREPYQEWLEFCLQRLLTLYNQPAPDPFEDLFNARREQRRGPLVAREVLNPEFDYHPEQAHGLLLRYLAGVSPGTNPLIRTPEAMREDGFSGI